MSARDDVQLVTLRIGGADFAFSIFQVERILRFQPPSALPKAPRFLEGMIPYAGGSVPVIDLRKRLNVDAPIRDETRIMVLEADDGKIGVVVDAVLEVLKVEAERIVPPPAIVRGLAAKYISGIVTIGERTIVVLAAPKLLSSKEQLALEQVSAEVAP
jgi:purine-binding chemotaxis protein CheW